MHQKKNKIFFIILITIVTIPAVIIYKKYNPENNTGIQFPKCAFYVITGYKCPGCGLQRALHHLLNGEIIEAIKQNFLAFLALPYIILITLANNSQKFINKFPKLTNTLNSYKSGIIALIVILVFWLTRNIFGF